MVRQESFRPLQPRVRAHRASSGRMFSASRVHAPRGAQPGRGSSARSRVGMRYSRQISRCEVLWICGQWMKRRRGGGSLIYKATQLSMFIH